AVQLDLAVHVLIGEIDDAAPIRADLEGRRRVEARADRASRNEVAVEPDRRAAAVHARAEELEDVVLARVRREDDALAVRADAERVERNVAGEPERPVELGRAEPAVGGHAVELADVERVPIRPVDRAAPVRGELDT